ncbi:MAG: urea ABC transporter substrate-binding protein [Candidatus Babeliaceae bacterium]|jgi:urea transport system substrate-binding protein
MAQAAGRKIIFISILIFALAAASSLVYLSIVVIKKRLPIRVGILHSQTGTMAISELPIIDATLMAIEEINDSGGLLGRSIEPIVEDGASDPATFAAKAEKLITKDKVDVIFGCWTSASRKAVKSIVEKHDHLLFYPVQYEGLEDSPNIIYTGATPNQQILPGVTWCYYNLGATFFLVGSDYVFPRTAHEIIKNYIKLFNGKIIGEAYVPLGGTSFEGIVKNIVALQPKVIINTINGNSNNTFFKALRNAGITPDKIPTMSFSIAEQDLEVLGAQELVGDYAAWSYFQSVASPTNERFVDRFKKKYGQDRVVSDPLEAAYFGIGLWAQAVREVKTSQVLKIKNAIKKQGQDAPEGIVYIDPNNNHTWKTVRIGKITQQGQFDIVWSSHKAIRPIPFPSFRGRINWEGFLEKLYEGWNKKWALE